MSTGWRAHTTLYRPHKSSPSGRTGTGLHGQRYSFRRFYRSACIKRLLYYKKFQKYIKRYFFIKYETNVIAAYNLWGTWPPHLCLLNIFFVIITAYLYISYQCYPKYIFPSKLYRLPAYRHMPYWDLLHNLAPQPC